MLGAVTNSVRVGNTIITSCKIHSDVEKEACLFLEKHAKSVNVSVEYINITEINKAEADLSCNVLHLNFPYL